MIRGSCLCGGMKYEIDGDLSGPLCSICGSTLVTISSVNPDMIELSLGTLDDDPGI
jgi:hypothetical protein